MPDDSEAWARACASGERGVLNACPTRRDGACPSTVTLGERRPINHHSSEAPPRPPDGDTWALGLVVHSGPA